MTDPFGGLKRVVHKNKSGKRVPAAKTVLSRYPKSRDLLLWAGIHAWNVADAYGKHRDDRKTLGDVSFYVHKQIINGGKPDRREIKGLLADWRNDPELKTEVNDATTAILDLAKLSATSLKSYSFLPEKAVASSDLNYGAVVRICTRGSLHLLYDLAIEVDSQSRVSQETLLYANVHALRENGEPVPDWVMLILINDTTGIPQFIFEPTCYLDQYEEPFECLRESYDIFSKVKKVTNEHRPRKKSKKKTTLGKKRLEKDLSEMQQLLKARGKK